MMLTKKRTNFFKKKKNKFENICNPREGSGTHLEFPERGDDKRNQPESKQYFFRNKI